MAVTIQPHMMKRTTAAAYCDLSVAAFEREVAAGTLPMPVMLGNREHWCKNAVNALLEAGCTIAEVAAITGQTFQVVEQYAAQVNRGKLGKAAILKLEAHRKIIPKSA